jgi:hypothetical protein
MSDIELDNLKRLWAEQEGKPIVTKPVQTIVSWLIVLGLCAVVGFIAIAVIFT